MADRLAEGLGGDYGERVARVAELADAELNRQQTPPALADHMDSEAWRAFSFGHGLIQVAKWLERHVETDFARPAGLSFAAFRMMSALKLHGSLAPSELADQLSLSRASVTSSLDTLERAGIVVREPRPEDGRGLLITLTAEGDSVVQRFLTWLGGQTSQAFAVLTRDELVVLDYLLRKVAAHQLPAPPLGRSQEG